MLSTIAKKRLIVCGDGTWNDRVSNDSPLTNVSKTSRLIKAADNEDGLQQVVSALVPLDSATLLMA
jgi:uncharacterized protein (DUF2235 family)